MKTLFNEPLGQALKEAYRGQTPPAPGPFWELKTMNRIRSLQPSAAGRFGLSVWRLAPVSALLTALVLAGSIAFDFSPQYALEELLLNAPVEQSVAMLIGY